MKKLIIALILLALAAPAWAYEQVIFTGTPHDVVLEDGTELNAIELSNGKGLYKLDPLRGKVGVYGDKTVYHWLASPAHVEEIKKAGDYLAGAWEDLPEGVYKAVMEVEIPALTDEGEPYQRTVKLYEADALGVSYTAEQVHPPHQWEGWE